MMLIADKYIHDQDEFIQRLNNWANWARAREVIPVSCRSIERKFNSNMVWEQQSPKSSIDIKDAIIIESILTGHTFSKKYMAIIVYTHVYPWLNLNGALRKINRFPGEWCKRNNIDDMQRKAEIFLRNRLCSVVDRQIQPWSNHI